MRGLKLLVIVLGVLLLGGTAALVVAIMHRVEERRAATAAAPSARTEQIALPQGATIVAAELAGDRLMLRLMLAGGGEEVLLFDAKSGALVATIGPSTKP